MSNFFTSKQREGQATTGSSTTSNAASGLIQNSLGGLLTNAGAAGSQIANLLGLNGATGQNDAFNTWKGSTGYQSGLDAGLQGVTGSAAAGGILNSGSAAKALNNYASDYASSKYGDYLNALNGTINSGLGAGGLIGNTANQTVNSSGVTTGSISKNAGTGNIISGLLGK